MQERHLPFLRALHGLAPPPPSRPVLGTTNSKAISDRAVAYMRPSQSHHLPRSVSASPSIQRRQGSPVMRQESRPVVGASASCSVTHEPAGVPRSRVILGPPCSLVCSAGLAAPDRPPPAPRNPSQLDRRARVLSSARSRHPRPLQPESRRDSEIDRCRISTLPASLVTSLLHASPQLRWQSVRLRPPRRQVRRRKQPWPCRRGGLLVSLH